MKLDDLLAVATDLALETNDPRAEALRRLATAGRAAVGYSWGARTRAEFGDLALYVAALGRVVPMRGANGLPGYDVSAVADGWMLSALVDPVADALLRGMPREPAAPGFAERVVLR